MIQTGGKERTTKESDFSPPILSQLIWMLSQRWVTYFWVWTWTLRLIYSDLSTAKPTSYPQWPVLKRHPVLKRRPLLPKRSLSLSTSMRYCVSSVHVHDVDELPFQIQSCSPVFAGKDGQNSGAAAKRRSCGSYSWFLRVDSAGRYQP